MMKLGRVVAGLALAGVAGGCAMGAMPEGTYWLKTQEFEGCECAVYCPCIFSLDATEDQCRGLIGWKVLDGRHGSTDLTGVCFAAALTKSAKNIEKALGKWEGVLWLPEQASARQRAAIEEIMKKELGGAFAKLEVKTAPVDVTCAEGRFELKIGTVGTLKVAALKLADGRQCVIENAPSPLALPKVYCAKAEAHTYDDGASKWDFAGRNGFYGPQEFKSK